MKLILKEDVWALFTQHASKNCFISSLLSVVLTRNWISRESLLPVVLNRNWINILKILETKFILGWCCKDLVLQGFKFGKNGSNSCWEKNIKICHIFCNILSPAKISKCKINDQILNFKHICGSFKAGLKLFFTRLSGGSR